MALAATPSASSRQQRGWTIKPLNDSLKQSLEEATARYEEHLESALPYLEGRGISRAIAENFRLGVVGVPLTGHEQYAGRLAVPSIGYNGLIYNIRFRSLNGEEPKYLGLHGMPSWLFNIRAIHEAVSDEICITEGEIDALTLVQAGRPAVGVAGANAWKSHHARMVAGFARVYVFGDGDKAGNDFAKKVTDSLDTGVRVLLPEGEDVNSMYVKHGPEGIDQLLGS